MDITAFIKELLFSHDCVVIPGFGGFIGNYSPARIDKNSGTFYPPVKQISFNRNLNHNDGLLIGRISLMTGMNYGDTRSQVEEFVSDTRRKLEKGEKVVFEKIGSFINNQEGNIQFEPDRSANYHLDSYGLEPFQCLPIEGYDVRKRITEHMHGDPVRQAMVRKILWRAAVIVPLLALIVAVPLKTDLFRAKVESTTMNPLVTAEFESNKKAVDDTNEKTALETDKPATELVKDEQPAGTDNPAPELKENTDTKIVVPVRSNEGSYIVITGSFKSKENADSQANMLQVDGFTPEVVTTDNGFYRVCAITCTDMKSAKASKDSIIDKFPGTWISKKK